MDESGPRGSGQRLIWEILMYLIKNPDAKDTVDGIKRWWISKGETHYQAKDVEQALDELVARGWVIKRVSTRSVFGLNKERIAEIERFLKERENG